MVGWQIEAVVAGNPARVIGNRFDDETRRRLLSLKWWDWADEKIEEFRYAFKADIEHFLEEAEKAAKDAAQEPGSQLCL